MIAFHFLVSLGLLALQPTLSVAYWRMACSVSQTARIDPILNPGGVSGHVHKFAGGNNVNENSDFNSLLASTCSSCEVQNDTSAYWTPQLYFAHANGEFEEVPNYGMTVYYVGRGGTPANTVPFPAGFRMLSGDSRQRSYDSSTLTYLNTRPVADRVSFHCIDEANDIPEQHYMFRTDCVNGMRAQVNFQSCWDGQNLYLENDAHVAYLSGIDNGVCPPTHPVSIPGLFFEVLYMTNNVDQSAGGQFVFSNGDPTGYGFHGDFMNGWDMDVQTNAVANCLYTDNGGVVTACPYLAASDNVNFPRICPEQASVLDEPVHGTIAALPGCNPITPGPELAPQEVCPVGATAAGPSGTTSAASSTTSAAATSDATSLSSSATSSAATLETSSASSASSTSSTVAGLTSTTVSGTSSPTAATSPTEPSQASTSGTGSFLPTTSSSLVFATPTTTIPASPTSSSTSYLPGSPSSTESSTESSTSSTDGAVGATTSSPLSATSGTFPSSTTSPTGSGGVFVQITSTQTTSMVTVVTSSASTFTSQEETTTIVITDWVTVTVTVPYGAAGNSIGASATAVTTSPSNGVGGASGGTETALTIAETTITQAGSTVTIPATTVTVSGGVGNGGAPPTAVVSTVTTLMPGTTVTSAGTILSDDSSVVTQIVNVFTFEDVTVTIGGNFAVEPTLAAPGNSVTEPARMYDADSDMYTITGSTYTTFTLGPASSPADEGTSTTTVLSTTTLYVTVTPTSTTTLTAEPTSETDTTFLTVTTTTNGDATGDTGTPSSSSFSTGVGTVDSATTADSAGGEATTFVTVTDPITDETTLTTQTTLTLSTAPANTTLFRIKGREVLFTGR